MTAKVLLLLIFLAGTFSVRAGEIVAKTEMEPYFKGQPKLMGRDIWNNAFAEGLSVRYPKELRAIAKEPMTKAGFAQGLPYITSYFSNQPPDNTRLIMREILIYKSGTNENIASKAKLSASAKDAKIMYPERIADGSDARTSASYSTPARIRENQEGEYTFDFGTPVTLDRVILKSGRQRSEAAPDCIHIAADFSIFAKSPDGTWKEIVARNGNANPDLEVKFASVTTNALRVRITGQTTKMTVSSKSFEKYMLDPARPFLLSGAASRPPYNCFEEYSVDKADYEKWKKKNPSMLGFYIGEWDSDYLNLLWRWRGKDFKGAMKKMGSSPAVIRSVESIFSDWSTRDRALAGLKTYFDAIARHHFGEKDKLVFIDCCRAFSHYAMEWGAKYYFMETTCNGYQRHQIQMYFIRGAARQYGNNWGWYIAPTLLGPKGYTDPDYIGKGSLGAAGGDGGFSPSTNKRDRFLAWFAGATAVFNEGWPLSYCVDSDKNGIWKLSPHGEAMKEWFDFISKHPERGVSYAPVAVALHWNHGMSPIHGDRPFCFFPNERGDMLAEAVFRSLVPYKAGLGGQEWAFSETPYGDIADVILPAPPSGPVSMDVLKNYRVLFLAGNFDPDAALAKRLVEYVKNGGTLVINTRQFGKNLPENFTGIRLAGGTADVANPIRTSDGKETFTLKERYVFDKVELTGAKPVLLDANGNVMIALNQYGGGNVVISTPNHLVPGNKVLDQYFYSVWGRDMKFPFIDFLLGKFAKDLNPVGIEGKVSYGFNRVKDGWLVYLFNNEGVSKTSFTAQKLDPSKTVRVKIDFRKLAVKRATDISCDKPLVILNNGTELSVPPGGIAVIRIETDGITKEGK